MWLATLSLYVLLLNIFQREYVNFKSFSYIRIILYSIRFFGVIHFSSIRFCLRLCMSTFRRKCYTFFFVLFLIHCYFSFTSNHIFLTHSLFMNIMFGFSIWILLKKTHLILIYNLFWKYTFEILFWRVYFYFVFLGGKILYIYILYYFG